MSFTFISTRIKIKYNYNIIYINTEFVQKHKKFPSPRRHVVCGASKRYCRHENFCSPFLQVASVESTRIYEKLVAKKVKDTPQM